MKGQIIKTVQPGKKFKWPFELSLLFLTFFFLIFSFFNFQKIFNKKWLKFLINLVDVPIIKIRSIQQLIFLLIIIDDEVICRLHFLTNFREPVYLFDTLVYLFDSYRIQKVRFLVSFKETLIFCLFYHTWQSSTWLFFPETYLSFYKFFPYTRHNLNL